MRRRSEERRGGGNEGRRSRGRVDECGQGVEGGAEEVVLHCHAQACLVAVGTRVKAVEVGRPLAAAAMLPPTQGFCTRGCTPCVPRRLFPWQPGLLLLQLLLVQLAALMMQMRMLLLMVQLLLLLLLVLWLLLLAVGHRLPRLGQGGQGAGRGRGSQLGQAVPSQWRAAGAGAGAVRSGQGCFGGGEQGPVGRVVRGREG